jgi:hypothetical protein
MQHAHAFEVVQDGRIRSTARSCTSIGAPPEEYAAALALAIERGWLEPHDSGTFVRFTQSGADPFA